MTARLVRGSEPARAESSPGGTCYVLPGHVVYDRNGGEEIRVYDRAPRRAASCDDESRRPRFVVPRAEEPVYFFGVYRDFLIVDAGCCPGPRGLLIYSLKTGEQVFKGEYSEPIQIRRGRLSFETPVSRHPPVPCPEGPEWEREGMSIGYREKVAFDFRSGRLIRTGKFGCTSEQ